MTASGKHRPMGARELVLLALLGALLLVTKLALAWLPNIYRSVHHHSINVRRWAE